ncbi:MAG: hypothetical protein Q8M66_07665 [Actinomycetota bacterium]|nr:hypothetical protein [Actinomycetota bacterium]MDZ4178792.1 hypothetical protein [Coriobacteriia bacterium]
MIPQAYVTLLSKLLERTKADDVNWREAAKDTFAVDFESFTLALASYFDSDQDPTVGVNLRNATGSVIDAFEVWESLDEDEYRLVYELFTLARRKALKIDRALDALARALDAPTPIGVPEDPGEEIPF